MVVISYFKAGLDRQNAIEIASSTLRPVSRCLELNNYGSTRRASDSLNSW